jgi:hypothetical protein
VSYISLRESGILQDAMEKESLYLLTTWSFVHEEYSRGEKYIFAL